jgi:beta-N-acetylhexosaminidase
VKWGNALKAAGVTMLLAPSMDVAAPGTQMDVQGRSFGATPEEVAARTTAFLGGVRDANPALAIVAKHYPGYSVRGHSDDMRVADSSPAAEVWRRAQPFENPAVDGVMVSSILYTNIDAQPACFSKVVIDRLREKRADAIVMTDDLCARAFANEDVRENARRAFKAGCDILLSLDSRRNGDIESAILELVNAEPAMRDRLDQSAARVLALAMRQQDRSWRRLRNIARWPRRWLRNETVRRAARFFARRVSWIQSVAVGMCRS